MVLQGGGDWGGPGKVRGEALDRMGSYYKWKKKRDQLTCGLLYRFPVEFACGMPTGKVTKGDHITVAPCNIVIVNWIVIVTIEVLWWPEL